MPPLQAELGMEVTKHEKIWRIIRITRQHSLVEPAEGGVAEIITEHLLELKGADGSIDFEVLSSERTPYTGPASTIKAPEPLNWRRD